MTDKPFTDALNGDPVPAGWNGPAHAGVSNAEAFFCAIRILHHLQLAQRHLARADTEIEGADWPRLIEGVRHGASILSEVLHDLEDRAGLPVNSLILDCLT